MRYLSFIFFIGFLNFGLSQDLPEFSLTDEWLHGIIEKAQIKQDNSNKKKKRLLIFSLMTGYQHWTTPHTEALIKMMAEKSGRFEVTTSTNIKDFEPAQLNTYDAIVLNNTCSKPADRNIFLDVLRQDVKLNEEKALEKAESLEKNLLQFVDKGKGLVILHGGITMLNKSKAFSNMVGGSFDYHPPQQPIEVHLVDPQHPMLLCFDGQGFEHVDEPYFFNKAYSEKYFKPLLYMDASAVQNKREATVVERQYLSWIKPHGAGRVFYASMSHNPQSYEHPALVKYLLNGLDYAVGYLQCDDTPMEK